MFLKARRGFAGFTLIELLVVIAITVALFSAGNISVLAAGTGLVSPGVSYSNSFSSDNPQFKLSFTYPDGWYVQKRGSSASTPLAVVISDINLNAFHGGYPDNFINIVFYKTNFSVDDYVNNDFIAKKISDKQIESVIDINKKSENIYKGTFKKGEYISSYRKIGNYVVIVESYVKDPTQKKQMEAIFHHIVQSIQFQ